MSQIVWRPGRDDPRSVTRIGLWREAVLDDGWVESDICPLLEFLLVLLHPKL